MGVHLNIKRALMMTKIFIPWIKKQSVFYSIHEASICIMDDMNFNDLPSEKTVLIKANNENIINVVLQLKGQLKSHADQKKR